jgi:hypothetical protein
MHIETLTQLIPLLQIAIAPVILISGVGLILLSMTNRLGRTIDRSRILSAQISEAKAPARKLIKKQLNILWKRARLIRMGIIFVSMSALNAAVLVIVLFFTTLYSLDVAWLIILIFSVCMACLILSLIFLIQDINLSLSALKLELKLDTRK